MIAEYSTAPPPTNPTTKWTITDMLGSPRILVNSLGEVAAGRDFIPFGEEIYPDETHRKGADKYNFGADGVRQKFTGYERDEETGLDFAEARYYFHNHGRFTAVDPLLASGRSANPQTFNRFIYVGNNPIMITDPLGLDWYFSKIANIYTWFGDRNEVGDDYDRVVGTSGEPGSFVYEASDGKWYALDPYTHNSKSFDTQEAATKQARAWYNWDLKDRGLTQSIATNSIQKGKIVGTLAVGAVVVGATGGVGLYATGALAGGTTTLGITGTGVGTSLASAGAGAGAGATLLPQYTKSTIQLAVSRVMSNPNNVSHIFHQKHLLQPLVTRYGSQSAVLTQVLNSLNGKVPSSGIINTQVNLGGYVINVTGRVVDGVPMISNLWIAMGPHQ